MNRLTRDNLAACVATLCARAMIRVGTEHGIDAWDAPIIHHTLDYEHLYVTLHLVFKMDDESLGHDGTITLHHRHGEVERSFNVRCPVRMQKVKEIGQGAVNINVHLSYGEPTFFGDERTFITHYTLVKLGLE